MTEEYMKLTNYVDRASSLAEQLQKDIKAGNKISNETVLALAKFIKAADNVKDMLEIVTEMDSKLN